MCFFATRTIEKKLRSNYDTKIARNRYIETANVCIYNFIIAISVKQTIHEFPELLFAPLDLHISQIILEHICARKFQFHQSLNSIHNCLLFSFHFIFNLLMYYSVIIPLKISQAHTRDVREIDVKLMQKKQ